MLARKGDIIELMCLNKHNNEEVEVGWRFRVSMVMDSSIVIDIPNSKYRSGTMIITHSQYFIYKTTFKNWVRNIFNKKP